MGLSAEITSALSDAETLHDGAATREVVETRERPRVIHRDDLLREVYCILGIPIDAVDMSTVLSTIQSAAVRGAPFVLSTPNLNFLVCALTDARFRESVLLSDLCPPDGMPLVWIARLTGVPIRRRVAGSDIFDALMAKRRGAGPLKLFLFGGADGVAAAASKAINDNGRGVSCVGSLSPGYGSVEELSRSEVIEQINASDADFLIAALGAQKGQLWLQHNHHRLGVPVRAHLGAVINFQARTVRRAPAWLKHLGLEWLWRIKEEPYLWQRYFGDGLVLLRLLVTNVLPLAVRALRHRLGGDPEPDLLVLKARTDKAVTLSLVGAATARQVDKATPCLREALATKDRVVIDVSRTRHIDARFFGLLLMLRKQLVERGARLTFTGVSRPIEKMFRLNGVGFLLSAGGDV